MGDNNKPPKSDDDTKTTASERLSQVKGHLGTGTKAARKRRSVRSTKDDLPEDYSDILGQLKTLRTMAATPDVTNRGYVRQKQAGKLWVRERVCLGPMYTITVSS